MTVLNFLKRFSDTIIGKAYITRVHLSRAEMLSVEELESRLRSHDSIVLFISGKIICGCSKQLDSLVSLADHITKCHRRLELKQEKEESVQVQEHFRSEIICFLDI